MNDDFSIRVQEILGRRIRRRRRALDISQETFAERAGIHRTQTTLYERGHRMPYASTLIKIAAALDVSVDQLLTGIEWDVEGPSLPDGSGHDPLG